MRASLSLALLIAIALRCPAQSPGAVPDDVLRLARMKRKARETVARLPSFTCLETIRREHRDNARAPFHLIDVVQVEVAHTGTGEVFAWPGKPFQARHLSELVGTAMTSDGDFALHAHDLFINDHPLFRYLGEESLAGHPTHRFDYNLAYMWSGWTIHVGGARGVVASYGSVWVDRDSLQVLRIEMNASEIPPQLPVQNVTTTIDYGPVRIGGVPAWLPQTAESEMTLLRGDIDRNQMEFSHCREYGAQSALHFEPEAEAGDSPPAPQLRLRAGLSVPIRLTTPVDSRVSRIGDRIEAAVDAEVRDKKTVVLPKGAKITGRVRRLERYRQPISYFIVSLEFTTVEVETQRTPFFGQLQRAERLESLNTQRKTADLPGVGTFMLEGEEFLLPGGWPMTWRTVTLSH